MMRLITLPISHYCEKVRWALERQNLPFREEGHVPVFHALHTLPTSRFSSRAVPILVDGNSVISDSSVCLRHLQELHGAAWLYAPPQAAALEAEFDEQLGPHSRCLLYFHALPDKQCLLPVFRQRVPALEALFAGPCFPVMRLIMRRTMKIDAEAAARSREHAVRIFDRVAERLRDGRRYLCGAEFSAADLAFAALAAPLVLPREYGGALPALEHLPVRLRDEIAHFRSTPAGLFALRLFREDRRKEHAVAPRA